MNFIPSIFSGTPGLPVARLSPCDQLISRSRAALRRGQLDLAESFANEHGDAIWTDAACLNLLGLIAESRGEWSKAKSFWSRSVRADKRYAPAQQNLRRYFELFQFGRTSIAVAFGDEPQFAIQEVRP